MNVQELFGIRLPILQAPMAGAQGSKLAIEVCEAGGLGALPCAMLSIDLMRTEIAEIKTNTRRPFNLNFFCHPEPKVDTTRDLNWRKKLAPYYAELGVDPSETHSGPARSPFDDHAAEIVEEFRPAVVSFHFGLPDDLLLKRVKAVGSKIISTATTLEEALWLEAHGVDAIIAQGVEAGGHRGMFLSKDLSTQVETFTLLQQICDRVKLPVIAAGGIVNAKGVATALSLGAAGVQIGTAYLLCKESTTSNVHRAALLRPDAHHTALTNVFSGHPARGIFNRAMRELGPISPDAPAFPLAAAAIAPLRKKAESLGLGDFSPLWSGQNPSGCKPISAFDLTRELASELSGAQ